ncbi:MAG TPA: carboxylesterase family protein [Caulobacteraceae bacterium]|nr:carboxylesterase family protein [Caulobacteraceae bacterium]
MASGQPAGDLGLGPECLRLEGGIARGTIAQGVLALEGIPFAAPPIGARRFRPPAPPQPWEGVLDASAHRTICPQIHDEIEVYPPAAGPVTTLVDGAPFVTYQDEDCLYLNIWRPADSRRDLPIMVFIPGGGFIVGGASAGMYSGAALAAFGVIVVTLNYRIGPFGFLELGSLDPSLKGSGNNGLRDQIAAIGWVRRNAEALGGDAENLTVMGESAGAISIAALLSTRSPETLFRRAILQSGGSNLVHTRAVQMRNAERFIQAGPLRSAADLRSAPVLDLLLQVRASAANSGTFAPYIDGELVTGSLIGALASGACRSIDILAGANAEEMAYWSMYDGRLRNPFLEDTDLGPKAPLIPARALAAVNQALAPATLDRRYAEVLGTGAQCEIERARNDDYVFVQPMTRIAELQAKAGGRAFLYRFDWRVPKPFLDPDLPDLGAMHALELPFVFGTLHFEWAPGGSALAQARRPQERDLSRQMMSAWTNFAKAGDPNGQGAPAWPAYDPSSRMTMIWAETSAAVADPDGARREIWEGFAFEPA